MQQDFHYYAAYCAAYLAGYPHKEAIQIAYADQFTDLCSRTLLKKLKAPLAAATTQLQSELMNQRTDLVGLQNITRIWASFHFLPYDLSAQLPKWHPKRYMNKYRLICKPNGELVKETVRLAKGNGLQAAGLAMHILSDTWAHSYFAGTPANVINNIGSAFYELREEKGEITEKQISFRHNPAAADDAERSLYSSSIHQESENSIMNLGHGRVGHLPDYSYCRYRYLPAWGEYEMITKDNPSDYFHAFTQMICALKYLRGERETFETGEYELNAVEEYAQEIRTILKKRQLIASDDWKAFGEKLSGESIEPFDINKYQQQYLDAPEQEKNNTFLGKFFLASERQKSMVTHKIFESGNLIAGFSVDYKLSGFKGMKDFKLLTSLVSGGENDDKH